jgi:N-acetyl-gamma-glutamyl-phosphate reductase
MPYSLIDHVHEREVSRQLAHPVEFMPHVAAYFRGLTITANVHLDTPLSPERVAEIYRGAYADEPLIRVIDSAPWVSRVAGKHHVEVGGFTVSEDGRRAVVVSTLDNLLKGAATQAIQNINLAFGFPEIRGLPELTEDNT